jgi:hypothetical protein
MTNSDKPLISKLSKDDKTKPIPVSKRCRTCKEEKLLSEFDFSSKSKSKRVATCKTCMDEKESVDHLGCCTPHFEQMVIEATFQQLDTVLQMVDVLQSSGVEIPKELLEKLFQIAHLGGVKCKHDICSRELAHKDP